MTNEGRVFSVFQVYDYKGGELSSSTNISFQRLMGEIAERYDNILDYENIKLESMTEEELVEFVKANPIEEDTYAGGDTGSFVGEIYEHKENKLCSISINEFATEVAEYINKEWRR